MERVQVPAALLTSLPRRRGEAQSPEPSRGLTSQGSSSQTGSDSQPGMSSSALTAVAFFHCSSKLSTPASPPDYFNPVLFPVGLQCGFRFLPSLRRRRFQLHSVDAGCNLGNTSPSLSWKAQGHLARTPPVNSSLQSKALG